MRRFILSLLFLLALPGSIAVAAALDPGFGNAGVVETQLPPNDREAISETSQGPLIESLALKPGGGFAAAVGSGTETSYFGVASYRASGALDRRFGGDGFIQLEEIFPSIGIIGHHSTPETQGVAVQPDGKIVLVGYRTASSHERPAPFAIRLTPRGNPDRRFGRRGLVAPRPGKVPAELLREVAVQPGGRIIAVGTRNDRLVGREQFDVGRGTGMVVAYRPNGRVDRSFGENGRVLFRGSDQRYVYTGLFDLAILPGGRLLVAGYRNNRLFVARLLRDGQLDRSFGGDGSVSFDLGLAHVCCRVAASVAALPSGKILVLTDGRSYRLLMARLRRDGTLDHSFGRHGIVKPQRQERSIEFHDLAVQRNGRIVTVGVENGRAGLTFAVIRFRPDGRRDRSFGDRGAKLLRLSFSSFGTSAVRLPNGQVVVGGGAQHRLKDHFEYSLVLARLRF